MPGRHHKLVRAKVESPCTPETLALFEPNGELGARGIALVDAAVQPREDHSLTLPVENESFQPVWLKKGQILDKPPNVALLTLGRSLNSSTKLDKTDYTWYNPMVISNTTGG